MKWTAMLSLAQRKELEVLDGKIAVLRVQRYKLQNAATQRVKLKEKELAKKRSGGGSKKAKANGRKAKSGKGRSQRARPRQVPAVVGGSGVENSDVGSGT